MIRIFPNRRGFAVAAAAIITAAALALLVVSTRAGQSANKGIPPEVRALVRQAMASTGLISVRSTGDPTGQAPRPRGSGVILRSSGVIVTNQHVITNTRTNRSYDEIYLSLSGDGDSSSPLTRYKIRPVLISKEYDLALLRVESDAAGNSLPKSFTLPSIELGDSRKIRVLEDIFIIGFPEKGGSTATVNRGVVEGKDLLDNWIKTDARIIHGNSGGAAVNSEGKLVGIPTKVLSDEQVGVDKDGDGFPDNYRRFGAVGFLRPSELVAEMLARLENQKVPSPDVPVAPKQSESSTLISVRGLVKAAAGGKPIAGALVGLVPLGESITESNLLTWAGTNSEGEFRLSRPVPPGRYTIVAKALAKQPYTLDIEIGLNAPALVIEMRSLSSR